MNTHYVSERECDSRFEAVLRHLTSVEVQILDLTKKVDTLLEYRWKLSGALLITSSVLAFLVSIIF